jgi:cytoskeletal protein CcmA (bactofilin family)
MFPKKASKPQRRIDSLIGAGTKIEGNVSFSGGLRVDGEIHGNACAVGDQRSTLVVSEHACIEGQIVVSHAVINGTIIGQINSGEFLELQSHARVTGDVVYTTIEMHLGAVVQGRLVHQEALQSGKSAELKLAASN